MMPAESRFCALADAAADLTEHLLITVVMPALRPSRDELNANLKRI